MTLFQPSDAWVLMFVIGLAALVVLVTWMFDTMGKPAARDQWDAMCDVLGPGPTGDGVAPVPGVAINPTEIGLPSHSDYVEPVARRMARKAADALADKALRAALSKQFDPRPETASFHISPHPENPAQTVVAFRDVVWIVPSIAERVVDRLRNTFDYWLCDTDQNRCPACNRQYAKPRKRKA